MRMKRKYDAIPEEQEVGANQTTASKPYNQIEELKMQLDKANAHIKEQEGELLELYRRIMQYE